MTKTLIAGLFAAMLALNFGAISVHAAQTAPKAAAASQDASAPAVKKSNTGICHAAGSSYYSRTLNFTPFATMAECIKSGGRLPKR
jgi:hypothetical protein